MAANRAPRQRARVDLDGVTDADAERAGYPSCDALVDDLRRRSEAAIHRIELGPLRPDPRFALRETVATDEREIEELRDRLRRLDAGAAEGARTARTLAVLRAQPGVRAGDLCHLVGQAQEPFKRNVRKLKSLGLSESFGTGYRLSPRGVALLEALSKEAADATT